MTASVSSPNVTTDPTALTPYLQEIHTIISSSVDTLIINTIFCSFLVPLAMALLLTSTPKWKTPTFSMNIAAITLGFAFGTFNIHFQRAIINLHPIDLKPDIIVEECLYFFVPLCTQSILLLRVFAVYPPRELTWWQNVVVYGTFMALVIARLTNAIVGLIRSGMLISHTSDASLTILRAEAWNALYVKVEFVLQLCHNVLASTLFLSQLHERGALRNGSNQASIFTNGGRGSYTTRLKGLFWIATCNFVFPVILNIVMIVFLFRGSNPVRLVDVMSANVFVDIICVILATVWSSGTYWQNPTTAGLATISTARFAEAAATADSLASATFAPPPPHAQLGAETSDTN